MRKLLALLALAVLPALGAVTDTFSGTLGSWTQFSGTWSISGGKAIQTAATTTVSSAKIMVWTTAASTADYSTSVDLTKETVSNATVGLVSRFTSTSGTCNFYMATVRTVTGSANDQIQLYKYSGSCTSTSNLFTQIGSTVTEEWTDGDTLTLSCVGTTISVRRNGVSKISVTDSTVTAAGQSGLRANNNGTHGFDNFSSTLDGSGVTYTISGTMSGAIGNGVTMALSGSSSSSTTTAGGGLYSFTVTGGGTFTVTPSLSGYSFTPPSQTFTSIAANQTADFTSVANLYLEPFNDSSAMLNFHALNTTAAFSVSGGQLIQSTPFDSSATGAYRLISNLSAPSADYYVEAKINRATTDQRTVSLIGRLVMTGSDCAYYSVGVRRVTAGTDSIQLYKWSASPCTNTTATFTQIGTTQTVGSGWVDGDTLRLAFSGTTITASVTAGTNAGFTYSQTDSTISGAGTFGVRMNADQGAIDDLSCSCIQMYNVSGTVSGTQASGVTITSYATSGSYTYTASTTTAGDGTYTFALPGALTHVVYPTYPGQAFTPGSRTLASLSTDQTARNFTDAPFTGVPGGFLMFPIWR